MNEDFSGSCAVASRNSLLHNDATNATWSWRLDAEGVPPGRRGVLGAVLEGSLATANFREFHFRDCLKSPYEYRKWDPTRLRRSTFGRFSRRFWPLAPAPQTPSSLFKTVSERLFCEVRVGYYTSFRGRCVVDGSE